QTGTTATSARFTGQDGHTYAFTSIATDNAGNVQQPPAGPQATTTVDHTPPTNASVNALPAVSHATNFTVSWSGSDNPGGSGLRWFDVSVAVDGASFQPLLTATTETSTTYTGAFGHRYGFSVVATDNVGNCPGLLAA